MSWSEFFAMKGYALYIWGSYGVSAIVVLMEVILVRRRKKLALDQVRIAKLVEAEET